MLLYFYLISDSFNILHSLEESALSSHLRSFCA